MSPLNFRFHSNQSKPIIILTDFLPLFFWGEGVRKLHSGAYLSTSMKLSHSFQHWWVCTWNAVSSSRPPIQERETWTHQKESSGGLPRWWRDWTTSPMRRCWESWDCSAHRRWGLGVILLMSANTWREGAKKMDPCSFQCAQCQDRRQWEQTGTQEAPTDHRIIEWLGLEENLKII